MSEAPFKEDTGYSGLRSLKEVYLSIFVLFFRISRWRGRMKARTATIGLTLTGGLAALSFGAWIASATHQKIEVSPWIVGIAFVGFYLLNDHFLVDRGRGIAFDAQFRNFSAIKQAILYFAAILIILATGAALYFSAAAYHQAFPISRG